ncbi:DMT family transporter [Flavobacterium sp.]|uniref:DMT family transporter n=1 Tax=Flavobacterium sp. TaxID=239 RepID=UPI00262FD48A|nr:DMT family transporter [Flavobacterium sp.]MDD3003646.1 DMT family transporter [Flavobacterium sp.]
MTQNNILKGVLIVALGATSYGMLATFVKIAYNEGFTTAEVTSSQFIYGLIGLLIINFIQKRNSKKEIVKSSRKDIIQLMVAGSSTGLTSLFYYLAVKYIPVSIGIVLLMQTVWMGVLLEWFLDKKAPSLQKIFAVFIILIGTALAINIFKIDFNDPSIDWASGISWGLLAAASFTTTMFTANRIATHVSAAQRSLFMLMGGATIVFTFALITQVTPFNMEIFMKWGILLALFGTIIPPLLLNAGFPLTGIGLGSIVSSLELPVSVLMAYFLLNEEVLSLQWLGILIIILAIVIMNINFKKKA